MPEDELISKLKTCELTSIVGGAPKPAGFLVEWTCEPGPSFVFTVFEAPEGASVRFFSDGTR
jgi:hypothetical protein